MTKKLIAILLSVAITSSYAEEAIPIDNTVDSVKSAWSYQDKKDEFEGTSSHRAMIVSSNEVSLGSPFNSTSAAISIIKSSKGYTFVAFFVKSGLLFCDIQNCTIKAKFDESPPITLKVTQSSSGNHKALSLFDGEKDNFISQLKTSKRLVIRVQFYKDGYKDFNFESSGLTWE